MIAMEFVGGGDLFALLEGHGPLDLPHTLFIIGSVTLMLEHFGACGFVYRDIK